MVEILRQCLQVLNHQWGGGPGRWMKTAAELRAETLQNLYVSFGKKMRSIVAQSTANCKGNSRCNQVNRPTLTRRDKLWRISLWAQEARNADAATSRPTAPSEMPPKYQVRLRVKSVMDERTTEIWSNASPRSNREA